MKCNIIAYFAKYGNYLNRCEVFISRNRIHGCSHIEKNKPAVTTECGYTVESLSRIIVAGKIEKKSIVVPDYNIDDIINFILALLNQKGYISIAIPSSFSNAYFPGHTFAIIKERNDLFAIIQSYVYEYEALVCYATNQTLNYYLRNYLNFMNVEKPVNWKVKDIQIWEKLTGIVEKTAFKAYIPVDLEITYPEISFDYEKCDHNIKVFLNLVRQKLKKIRLHRDIRDIKDLETFAYIDNPHNIEYINGIIDLVEKQINIMEEDIVQPMNFVVKCTIKGSGFLKDDTKFNPIQRESFKPIQRETITVIAEVLMLDIKSGQVSVGLICLKCFNDSQQSALRSYILDVMQIKYPSFKTTREPIISYHIVSSVPCDVDIVETEPKNYQILTQKPSITSIVLNKYITKLKTIKGEQWLGLENLPSIPIQEFISQHGEYGDITLNKDSIIPNWVIYRNYVNKIVMSEIVL